MSDNDNQMTTILDNFGPVAEVFKTSPVDPSRFTAGIGMAWPILTLRGKTWGWRFRGEGRIYEAPNPNAGGSIMPVQHLDVVLVDAGTRISKVYYKDGYNPQAPTRKPPDCWSADGITPDQGVNEKQSTYCRGCRHNVFGSNIGPQGQKGKACSDNKRLAVVTMDDLPNTDFGGPFMLRLPPGSFSNYTTYCSVMAARGYQPYTVVTRLMFDPQVAHPKVIFFPQRPLKPEEAVYILAHQANPRTSEMLNDKAVAAFADPEVDSEGVIAPLPTAEQSASTGGTSGWSATVTPGGNLPATPPVEQPAKPELTPEQKQIAELEAQLVEARNQRQEAKLAEARKVAEPEPVLTPEQLQIKELQAQLAEAKAPKKAGRPRTKPVGPPTGAETPTQASNGAGSDDEPEPTQVGNDISNRIAGLVKKNTA
jgi:hypothetical protein